jgi:FkbM family methyltransferase
MGQRGTIGEGLDLYYLNLEETRFLYGEIFEAEGYLRNGIRVSESSVVFDVGANIGLFGIYLNRRWPGVRLYCFEPMPDTVEVLRANIALHGLQALLFPCALGHEAGPATFTFYPHNSVMSGRYADHAEDTHTTRTFLSNRDPAFTAIARENPMVQQYVDGMIDHLFEERSVTVDVMRLTDVIAREEIDRIDLLKIDVEKAEHEVIAGIGERDWDKVQQVVIETHDREGRLDDVTRLLDRQGFEVIVEEDPMLASLSIYNVYARRS